MSVVRMVRMESISDSDILSPACHIGVQLGANYNQQCTASMSWWESIESCLTY